MMIDKYKFVCLVLAIALVAALVRLVFVSQNQSSIEPKQTVMENILSRKSVRSYTDRPVSREQLDTLVRAAMAAPTGRDMRPWRFVVINERETLAALADSLPFVKMLPEAQTAIVVCGDMSVTDKEGNPSRNWPLDCSAATENLLLMAESMGLGAVWTGVYPYEERMQAVKSALNLPDDIVPFNLIPVGYPKGDPQPKDKFDQSNIHYNVW